MNHAYFEPTQAAGAALFSRDIPGEVIMLNMLRFKDIADYSATPQLAPATSISGKEAFDKYIAHTRPFLQKSGGELMLIAEGGAFFIGPSDEHWDLVMLVKQRSLQDFIAFAGDEAYLEGLGHRTAALSDSRLLPLVARGA